MHEPTTSSFEYGKCVHGQQGFSITKTTHRQRTPIYICRSKEANVHMWTFNVTGMSNQRSTYHVQFEFAWRNTLINSQEPYRQGAHTRKCLRTPNRTAATHTGNVRLHYVRRQRPPTTSADAGRQQRTPTMDATKVCQQRTPPNYANNACHLHPTMHTDDALYCQRRSSTYANGVRHERTP